MRSTISRVKLFTGLNGFGNYAEISVTQAFYAIRYSDRTLKHSIEQSTGLLLLEK